MLGKYKIPMAGLGSANNGAFKQKMCCCRDEVWGGWDLPKRGGQGTVGTRGRKMHGWS